MDSLPFEKGIAKNAALKENIFAILPCIMNRIPIFICGKPGCSKSLAIHYLLPLLLGQKSQSSFFKGLTKVTVIPFQGSDSCTSEGVEKVFAKAEKCYREGLSVEEKNLPVIVFDEIGLAEISVHNPLKVLHRHLEHENKKIGFIAVSNWRLDSSKMNRALYLARPDPDENDLLDTARSLYLSFCEDIM